jgi:hypothetical protein
LAEQEKEGFEMISPEDVAKLTFSYFMARAVFIITIWSVFMAIFIGTAVLSVAYLEYKIEHTDAPTR